MRTSCRREEVWRGEEGISCHAALCTSAASLRATVASRGVARRRGASSSSAACNAAE